MDYLRAAKDKPNFLVRKQGRSAMTVTLLKANVGRMAYGVQRRLVCLRRDFHACTDAKLRVAFADCALRHEEMILRIIGHPLPGRARVTQATMRTLDVEPISTELLPPPVAMDSGLDSAQNGEPESLGNSGETN